MPAFDFPQGPDAKLFNFAEFGTLNNRANRPGIADNEFSWNQNWMPIGPWNLRTIPGEGDDRFAFTDVIYMSGFNFGPTRYIAVFQADGTAYQLDLFGSTTPIGNVSTFYGNASTALPCCTQYESKYLIIGSTQTANGYSIWDGHNLFQAGGLSPDVTVTSGGGNYTSAPTVTVYGGAGSGATFLATVADGAVVNISVTDPGVDYLETDMVQLAFTGGGSDTSARGNATIVNTGGVSSVSITNQGGNYTTSSVVTFSGGGGSGAQAVVTGLSNGAITEITVTNPGGNYTTAPNANVSVGSGFQGVVDIRRGQVGNVTVTDGGTGYTSNPQVILSPPDASAFPVVQATAVAVIGNGTGNVTGVIITEPGLGYLTNPTVTFIGGNDAAEATASLMPFGIQASTLETIQNSVWAGNGTNILATAPESTTDFATSAGGVSVQAVDAFLRYQVTCLKQTTGFMYVFGDSSISVLSNIQTNVLTSGQAATTFNSSNVDAQIGTPWRDTVVAFNRALVFANETGVYALYGGAAEKVSGPIDGLFLSADFNVGLVTAPSASCATIFGIRVYLLLFTTVNSYTNQQEKLMAAWDGQKWFVATQNATLSYITTSEINSQIDTFATDGNHTFFAFQKPSTTLEKVFQTKLRAGDGLDLITTKQVNAVYLSAESNQAGANVLQVSLDTEKGQGSFKNTPVTGTLVFVGSGGPITFVGMSPIEWESVGFVTTGYGLPDTYGRFVGMTGQTNAADITLLQLAYLYAPYASLSP